MSRRVHGEQRERPERYVGVNEYASTATLSVPQSLLQRRAPVLDDRYSTYGIVQLSSSMPSPSARSEVDRVASEPHSTVPASIGACVLSSGLYVPSILCSDRHDLPVAPDAKP